MLYDNLSIKTALIVLGILIIVAVVCLVLIYKDLKKLGNINENHKTYLETLINFESFFIIITVVFTDLVLLFGDTFFMIFIFIYLLLSIFISLIIISLRSKL